jgi:plastocyanin
MLDPRRYLVGSRFSRRAVTALAMGAAAAASLVLTAPTAVADQPQAKTMRLLDQCDKPSWDVGFPGLCTTSAGSVTLTRFRADLAKGGNGNWWINNRNETIDAGDSLHVVNEGGIVHTFTEVRSYGKGVIDEWNTAIPTEPQAVTIAGQPVSFADFGTAVPPGTSSDVVPAKGVHLYQCIVHPWMRTVVTVR